MNIPKIIIADDEEGLRQTLNKFISERLHCELYEASNGYEALAHVKNKGCDLMLLDYKMPGISGIEVLKEVRKIVPDAIVFVITKWDSPEVSREIQDLGAEYIPKPLALKLLMAKIQEKLKAINKYHPIAP
jgi:DNA-binding response OmpR family regulator